MKKLLKKLLCLSLAAILGGTTIALAACAGSGNEEGKVVMSFVAGTNLLPDEDKVEAAVDAYCQETYGIGVIFKHVNIYDQASVYTNWLGANEEIDIVNLCFVDPMQYINEKRIRPLTELIDEENAPYLSKTLDSRPDMKLLDKKGTLYGIGTQEIAPAYSGSMIIFKKSVLEKIGLYGEGEGQYKDYDVVRYEDLDKLFAAIKSNPETNKTEEGADVYPCPIIASTAPTSAFVAADFMSSGTSSPLAVLEVEPDGSTSPEVVNYYELETFKTYIEKVSEWNAKGYIHPDAVTATDPYTTMIESGRWVSMFLSLSPGLVQTYNSDKKMTEPGDEWIPLALTDVPYYTSSTPLMAMAINSKSKRPEKAMRIIDAIFSDEKLVNMLQYGIEGEHWVYVGEEEGNPIGKEEGYIYLTQNNLDKQLYTGLPGIYGDKDKVYTVIDEGGDFETLIAESEASNKLTMQIAEEALSHSSVATGFIYDPSKQKARISNIEGSVLSQYVATLTTGKGSKGSDGTYTGSGSTYDNFIKALKNAKVDLVIADKQEQLDEWLALKG